MLLAVPQVQHKDEWVDVPPIEGTVVVNGGDYLSLLSGGRFVSPVHRVMLGPQERYSMVGNAYWCVNSRVVAFSPDV